MTEINPRTLLAGERESGTLCARCSNELKLGDDTSICRNCGAVHHSGCWTAGGGCSAYECSPAAKTLETDRPATLMITRDELAAAQPLPSRSIATSTDQPATPDGKRRRWNRVAVSAFVVALLGIPLFGLITGLIAMVIACIALAGHAPGRRGLGLAVVAIVIGLFEVIGWAVALSVMFGTQHGMVALDELTLDPESLDALPERIARAMRANVVIQSGAGIGRQGIGSGVILMIQDGIAHIVTNRHMVDFGYSGSTRTTPKDFGSMASVQVITVGQDAVPAKIEWVAPHGVDLAIVSAPILSESVEAAHWDRDVAPRIGDEVFAVGNPHGLGWTHSAGDVSQIRRQTHGDYKVRVLQTTAAINPGNSGGGLYDTEGRLIGINTLTGDKRFAEGLGFAISLPTLLELVADDFELPPKNPAAAAENQEAVAAPEASEE